MPVNVDLKLWQCFCPLVYCCLWSGLVLWSVCDGLLCCLYLFFCWYSLCECVYMLHLQSGLYCRCFICVQFRWTQWVWVTFDLTLFPVYLFVTEVINPNVQLTVAFQARVPAVSFGTTKLALFCHYSARTYSDSFTHKWIRARPSLQSLLELSIFIYNCVSSA